MTMNFSSPLSEIVDTLRNGKRFVLSSHARPDGDSIGSQLALAHSLSSLGKIAQIVNHDPPPTYLDTLPGVSNIEVSPTVVGAYDAAIVLECASLNRTNVLGLEKYRVINIDHHTGNSMYGALNWFDPSAAACAEMIYDVVVELLRTTLGAIEECWCADGYPGCVQSPKCGNNNEPLDKAASKLILERLLVDAAEEHEATSTA